MQIKETYKIEYVFVITDSYGWNFYRRQINGGKDDWECLMGNSWEIIFDAVVIEDLYQSYLKDHAGI